MKRRWKMALSAISVFALLALSTCDMQYIDDQQQYGLLPHVGSDGSSGGGSGGSSGSGSGGSSGSGSTLISQEEMEELERSGHYLKLTNMPLITQIKNVSAVSVANSAEVIANREDGNQVKIFRGDTSSIVYIPLVYSDGTKVKYLRQSRRLEIL